MKEDILIPPTGGWSAATLYIAVNPTADAMKRKREEEVTQGSGVNKNAANSDFLRKLKNMLLQLCIHPWIKFNSLNFLSFWSL